MKATTSDSVKKKSIFHRCTTIFIIGANFSVSSFHCTFIKNFSREASTQCLQKTAGFKILKNYSQSTPTSLKLTTLAQTFIPTTRNPNAEVKRRSFKNFTNSLGLEARKKRRLFFCSHDFSASIQAAGAAFIFSAGVPAGNKHPIDPTAGERTKLAVRRGEKNHQISHSSSFPLWSSSEHWPIENFRYLEACGMEL